MNGADATAVVMLSGGIDPDRVREALAVGAQGYIPNESRDEFPFATLAASCRSPP